MNYSLQPEADFIEVMREIFAALHWIEANAQNYGFDCSRLFVTGDSAGGHYAMLVAAIQKSVQLQEYYQIRPVDSGSVGWLPTAYDGVIYSKRRQRYDKSFSSQICP